MLIAGTVPPPPAPIEAREVGAFAKFEECKVAGQAIAAQYPGSTFKCIVMSRPISP